MGENWEEDKYIQGKAEEKRAVPVNLLKDKYRTYHPKMANWKTILKESTERIAKI